jgi:hypothetical protein
MVDARPHRTEIAIVAACVAVGAALRVRGVLTDFWLDEVWSLFAAVDLASPIEILTRLHDDNNHPLNSLWMYGLGERQGWYVYRFPALVAGIATIAAAWLAARRTGAMAGVLAAVLVATSYPMVLYASEARGYAPMLLCGIVALVAAPAVTEARTSRRRAAAAATVVVASIGGMLSHLLFFHWYAGIAAASVVAGRRSPDRRDSGLVLATHGAVVVAAGLLWLVFARHLPAPRGPVHAYLDVTIDAVSLAFGGPARAEGGPAAAIAATVALGAIALAAAEIARSLRERDPAWIAPAVACFLAPALTLLAMRPEVVFVRYFLVAIVGLYLLAARYLARLAVGGALARVTLAVLLAAFLAGQVRHLMRFHEHGRGGYVAAIRHVAAASGGASVTVSSDHAFRNGKLVEFYAARVPGARVTHVVYRGSGSAPGWWLVHRFDGQPAPPPILRFGPARYRREGVFPHGSLSGWTWYLYRSWPEGETGGL